MVAKKNTIFQYMNGRLSCFLIKKTSKIVNELTIRNLTIEETFFTRDYSFKGRWKRNNKSSALLF